MLNKKNLNQPGCVIIADDDQDDQELLQAALLDLNFPLPINMVNDGIELLEQLNLRVNRKTGSYPCLIILDINMPKKNGMEVLKELKTNPSYESIPVIMYSTSQNEDTRASCYQLGANTYIRKPVSQKELNDVAASIKNLWVAMGQVAV